MSRTDKDRPWNVRAADPKEDRQAHHDHLSFGRKIVASRPKLDEKGNPVTTTTYHTGNRWHNGGYSWEENYPITRVVYEKYLVGYVANYCTVDEGPEANSWHSEGRLYPCSHHIVQYSRNRPWRDDKQAYHGSSRRAERDSLVNMANRYNSGYDLEDYDEDNRVNSRSRRHIGYWD